MAAMAASADVASADPSSSAMLVASPGAWRAAAPVAAGGWARPPVDDLTAAEADAAEAAAAARRAAVAAEEAVARAEAAKNKSLSAFFMGDDTSMSAGVRQLDAASREALHARAVADDRAVAARAAARAAAERAAVAAEVEARAAILAEPLFGADIFLRLEAAAEAAAEASRPHAAALEAAAVRH
jgi:hypothetical protein